MVQKTDPVLTDFTCRLHNSQQKQADDSSQGALPLRGELLLQQASLLLPHHDGVNYLACFSL